MGDYPSFPFCDRLTCLFNSPEEGGKCRLKERKLSIGEIMFSDRYVIFKEYCPLKEMSIEVGMER